MSWATAGIASLLSERSARFERPELSLRHDLSMSSFFPEEATPAFIEFVTERHLAVLTLVRPNGRPHATPVGFTWDPENGLARVITWSGSAKSRILETGSVAGSLCQVDGGRWAALEGQCLVLSLIHI